jgi:hypothetical protein
MRGGLGFKDNIETLAEINNSSGSGNRILISGSLAYLLYLLSYLSHFHTVTEIQWISLKPLPQLLSSLNTEVSIAMINNKG